MEKTARKYKQEIVPVYSDTNALFDELTEKEIIEMMIEDEVQPDDVTFHYDEQIGSYLKPIYSLESQLQYLDRVGEMTLDDERCNLNKQLPARLFVCEMEDGSESEVYDVIPLGKQNLNECFTPHCNGTRKKVTVEGEELCIDEGVMFSVMRMQRTDLSNDDLDALDYALVYGEDLDKAIKEYTVPLGDYVRDIYGAW